MTTQSHPGLDPNCLRLHDAIPERIFWKCWIWEKAADHKNVCITSQHAKCWMWRSSVLDNRFTVLTIDLTEWTMYYWVFYFTPDRRQSKKLILSMNIDQKSLETEFSIDFCRLTSDKWQWKKLFLAIFDPHSSIVKSVLFASYQVCIYWWKESGILGNKLFLGIIHWWKNSLMIEKNALLFIFWWPLTGTLPNSEDPADPDTTKAGSTLFAKTKTILRGRKSLLI